jgi:hypothetical protein
MAKRSFAGRWGKPLTHSCLPEALATVYVAVLVCSTSLGLIVRRHGPLIKSSILSGVR